MSYILNGVTVKRPTWMTREPIEVASDVLTIGGSTKRDITARKYRYILAYSNISAADAATLQTLYDTKAIVTFQSTDTNFTVSLRDVHMDITPKKFETPGTAYLANLDVILTEVDE